MSLRQSWNYVKDLPSIQQEVHQVHATVNDMRDRLDIIEYVVRDHERETKSIKSEAA